MLTEEQIKNLKHGDKLSVEVIFLSHCFNGDIFTVAKSTSELKKHNVRICFPPDVLSLPDDGQSPADNNQSKYDSHRKFKKGDKVDITYRNGRLPVDLRTKVPLLEENVTVVEDEDDNGLVQVRSNSGHKKSVYFFFLELVSSVEDQMPYSIDPTNTNVLLKDGKKLATFEDYDEAQEVRDRLNAEWKERDGMHI